MDPAASAFREGLWGLVHQVVPWMLLLAGLVFVLGLFKLLILPRLKGKLGEARINYWVRRKLDPAVYHLIPDVTLPSGGATTQIDHVIVSRYGVFVIETKTYKGWIFGNASDPQWTQVNYGRKDRFQNPLRQNFKHTETLAELTGIPREMFKSMVVFAGDCRFKTEMPANVVLLRDFILHIRSHQTPVINDGQVPEIVATIREWAGTVSPELKAQHVANLRKNKAPASANGPPPECPRCGGAMVLRTGKNGRQFWGCPKYPACRGIRQTA